MVSRVLVAHLCLTDIPPFPSLLTLPVLFSLNALTPVFFGSVGGTFFGGGKKGQGVTSQVST